jgi:hypothetical protein
LTFPVAVPLIIKEEYELETEFNVIVPLLVILPDINKFELLFTVREVLVDSVRF